MGCLDTLYYKKQTQNFTVFHLKMKISQKNKANSNPIKPNQTQFWPKNQGDKANTKPISIPLVWLFDYNRGSILRI
jgi:hypothetical protein